MKKAMPSARVPGGIWPCILLSFTIPGTTTLPPPLPAASLSSLWSLRLHPSLSLFLNLSPCYECQSLDSGRPTLLILSAKTLFPYQFTFVHREVRTHVLLAWDTIHIQPSTDGVQTTHLLCSAVWIMKTPILTWPRTASYVFTHRWRWVRQSRMRKQSLRFLGSLLSPCGLLVHGKSLIPSVKTSFNLHLALAFFLSHISWLQHTQKG